MDDTGKGMKSGVTDKAWKVEVADSIAASGLPWRVSAAWVNQGGVTCGAVLVDVRTGKERTVSLSHETHASAADRRAEIIRQLTP